MKKLLFLILSGFCFLMLAEEWQSSYRTAKKKAIRENKKVLIFSSGSDWCEAGRILDRDLFRTGGFQRLASEKYILYNADFPKYRRLGQEQEEQNRRLASRYGIHRYPAVIVVDPKYGGLLVKQVGMKDMTPRELLEKLSRIEAETIRSDRLRSDQADGKTAGK